MENTLSYIFSRLMQSVFVLLFMSFVCYILIGLMPGDPIDIMLAANPETTADDAARLRALHGLDTPLPLRYWNWLTDAMQGHFGYSRLFGQPVLDLILQNILPTFILMISGLLLSLLIAFPIGIIAAYKHHSLFDRMTNLACFAGISIPSFWLGLLLISFFAVDLMWLPAGGFALDDSNFLTHLQFLILPLLTLSLASVAGYTRYIRAAMIDNLNHDFIRTAKAKGCSTTRVLLHHGLRGALAPIITILSLDFGRLFGGALIIETIFARPGMGKLIYDSILGSDYNLAILALMGVTLIILIGNLVADLCYLKLDPRIKLNAGAV